MKYMKFLIRRFFNLVFDSIVVAFITILTYFIFANILGNYHIDIFVIYLVIYFIYYTILEYLFSKTIGKLLTNTRVEFVGERERHLGLIILRTISRVIPLEPFSIFFDDEYKMWHDKLSKTRVTYL